MKVLIVEDDPGIVEAISLLFRIRWPETEFISTKKGESALLFVEEFHPELVILDLGLPDSDGLDILKQLRLFSKVPVIIVSARGGEAEIVRGLEYGADDYIVKPFKQLEFIARMKSVVRRQEISPIETTISKGPFSLVINIRTLYIGDKKVHLTHTESLIIAKLLQNANMVVTHHALSQLIWGETIPDSVDAIRVYISRIRQKIGTRSEIGDCIISEKGIGYRIKISD